MGQGKDGRKSRSAICAQERAVPVLKHSNVHAMMLPRGSRGRLEEAESLF